MTACIELSKPDAMSFAKDGALRIRAALDASDLRRLEHAVANLPPDQAGIRLYGIPVLRPFLASPGAIWKVAASVLGEAARPVRAILFDIDRFHELGTSLASGSNDRGHPAGGGRGFWPVDR